MSADDQVHERDRNGRRWEGSVDASLRELRRRLDGMEQSTLRCEADLRHEMQTIHGRVTRLEIKVAWFAGAFSLIGGVVGGIITTLVTHLMHG